MEPRPARLRVLVAEPDPRVRLLVVSALSERYDVLPLPEGEDAVRTARNRRPELVLLGMDRARADDVLRACRTLRTDVRPIERVAIYARGAAPRPAEVVVGTWCADGYLAGPLDAAGVRDFAEAVVRGERPVRVAQGPTGAVGRLLGRLRGR